MKIGIVGGGPAGLYVALLIKKHFPLWSIELVEQNPADNTYGWGVVFSGRALSFLEASDPDSYEDIKSRLETWDQLVIVHRGQSVPIDGSYFSGIGRIGLLQILQRHCLDRGVVIRFQTRFQDLEPFSRCDLIIGADGVNSMVREQYRKIFQPTVKFGSNKYVWYGTTQVFGSLSLIFHENNDGIFVGHAYRYSPTNSTFIVECDATTWERAGLGSMSDEESRRYCENVFERDLRGNPLLSNKSMWLNFAMVSNQRWSYKNVVLIGDALRTVHFSIGSGTRTALEDAIALAKALEIHGEDLRTGVQTFIENRRPSGGRLLDVAHRSLVWYENLRQVIQLEPVPFAYDYMTRGGRVDHETLRKRAPKFAAAYESLRS
ncbi:MAG: monooxygenase [Deltaproteobacteria bacterium]|nr:monooxygenase [Deltaproteobacteria bacterium]